MIVLDGLFCSKTETYLDFFLVDLLKSIFYYTIFQKTNYQKINLQTFQKNGRADAAAVVDALSAKKS